MAGHESVADVTSAPTSARTRRGASLRRHRPALARNRRRAARRPARQGPGSACIRAHPNAWFYRRPRKNVTGNSLTQPCPESPPRLTEILGHPNDPSGASRDPSRDTH